MRKPIALIASTLLIASIGTVNADDHLFNAQQSGLRDGGNAINHTHAYDTNQAGHSGDLAPGQGSPFAGDDMQTPATDTEAANDHANVKEREAK